MYWSPYRIHLLFVRHFDLITIYKFPQGKTVRETYNLRDTEMLKSSEIASELVPVFINDPSVRIKIYDSIAEFCFRQQTISFLKQIRTVHISQDSIMNIIARL